MNTKITTTETAVIEQVTETAVRPEAEHPFYAAYAAYEVRQLEEAWGAYLEAAYDPDDERI